MATIISPPNQPRRRLSSRRGSASAPDPFNLHDDGTSSRGAVSRLTIVRAPQPIEQEQDILQGSISGLARRNSHRSSWGSAPNRVSFAVSNFTPINKDKDPNTNASKDNAGTTTSQSQIQAPHSPGRSFGSGPASPTIGSSSLPYRNRSGSNQSLKQNHARNPSLTPQQICDLAISSINPPKVAQDHTYSAGQPTQFMPLPDEYYLPFLDRPAEVTALLTSHPTFRLITLLIQTFPSHLRAPFDPLNPPKLGPDPAKWSFAELSCWLQTVPREVASDREWTVKARSCVLARSELIWSRLKGALGVPPELEEDYDDWKDEYRAGSGSSQVGSLPVDEPEQEQDRDEADRASQRSHATGTTSSLDEDYTPEREAWVDVILPGDTATCVASPLVNASPNTFGFGGREGGMESIGEGLEEEDEERGDNDGDMKKRLPIQGLRISTSLVEITSPGDSGGSSRSRSSSPVVAVGRVARHGSMSVVADIGSAPRGPGRVRRSTQQEQGIGGPLFPSSFARLTMGPTLVANNPALRTGPTRPLGPGLQLSKMRKRYSSDGGGWDTDGNDYALSLGSGSERSFVMR